MNTSENIVHDGIVEKIINGVAFVSFHQPSGCSGCSIKSACGMADSGGKVIEVPVRDIAVDEGDEVSVSLSKKDGYKAVLISYVVPFILVLVTLIVSLQFNVSESAAGVISLFSLVPYYGLLRLFRTSFKNELSIEVQKR
jgi:positive regulator of sigma E activity